MGTKSDDARAALVEKRKKIDAKLKALDNKQKAEERKALTRRKIIVGGAVLAHASLHPEFAVILSEALNLAVTSERDREALSDILGPLKPDNPAP